MNDIELEQYENLGPFEIKDFLAKLDEDLQKALA